MTRSRKKNPGGGFAVADSDKPFKVSEHRRERHQVAAALRHGREPDDPRVYGAPCRAPKDGKMIASAGACSDSGAKWGLSRSRDGIATWGQFTPTHVLLSANF